MFGNQEKYNWSSRLRCTWNPVYIVFIGEWLWHTGYEKLQECVMKSN